jgi:hypothetical protein
MSSSPEKRNAAPKSELDDFKGQTFFVSTIHGFNVGDVHIEQLPALEAAAEGDFKALFSKKCAECSKLCDFSQSLKDCNSKELKASYLLEFEKLFTKPRFVRIIVPDSVKDFLRMCKLNIGRSYSALRIVSSVDCPDNVLDVAWPHLQLVYNALKSLLLSKLSSTVTDTKIVSLLVYNTLSSDERERQAAKECLSSFARNVSGLKQSVIVNSMQHIQAGDCSAELLGLIYDLVPDLQLLFPTKFKSFFRDVVRLHNSFLHAKFSTSLSQCLTRFIRADQTLLNELIRYLATHWPTSGIKKQVTFTDELGSLMENFGEAPIERDAAVLLFQRLSCLVLDPGVDVAESALSFFIGPGNEATLLQYIDVAMQRMVSNLNACRRDHWNVFIRDDARIALDLLSKANPVLFSEQVQVIKNQRKSHRASESGRVKGWEMVFQTARKVDPQIRSGFQIVAARA